MRNAPFLRLAVVLLDESHSVKGVALAEGQPRFAVRRAMENALRLCASTPNVDRPRLVIIPAGGGVMPLVMARAQAFSKAGQALEGFTRDQLLAMGRRAAFVTWCGLLAEQVRADRAREVMATRVA